MMTHTQYTLRRMTLMMMLLIVMQMMTLMMMTVMQMMTMRAHKARECGSTFLLLHTLAALAQKLGTIWSLEYQIWVEGGLIS